MFDNTSAFFGTSDYIYYIFSGLTIPGYTQATDPVENLNAFVLNYPGGFAQVYEPVHSNINSL